MANAGSPPRGYPGRAVAESEDPVGRSDSDGMTYHCYSSYDFTNSKRSALIVAASVVGMPCGNPL